VSARAWAVADRLAPRLSDAQKRFTDVVAVVGCLTAVRQAPRISACAAVIQSGSL
jgi:hypothetical protein